MFRQGTALDRLREAVTILTNQPGSTDDIMAPLTESLNTCIGNEAQMEGIVAELVQQVKSLSWKKWLSYLSFIT